MALKFDFGQNDEDDAEAVDPSAIAGGRSPQVPVARVLSTVRGAYCG